MKSGSGRVVVVGGGIAGLTAAYARSAPTTTCSLLEGRPESGGKLRRAEVAGVAVDVGAEAMLNRRPEGVDLVRELGLPVVHPASTASGVWSRGALRRLPRTLLGVPLDVDDLRDSGVLGDAALARVARRAVGARERPHRGPLGGRAGGRAAGRGGRRAAGRAPARRGVRRARGAALGRGRRRRSWWRWPGGDRCSRPPPQLPSSDDAGVRRDPRRARPAARRAGRERPVRGADRGAPSASCDARATGFRLTVGSAHDPRRITADAVVLAVPGDPGRAAAGRRRPGRGRRARPRSSRPRWRSSPTPSAPTTLGDLAATAASGFLVPPVEGRRIKAATYSFAKWAWVREAGDGLLLLRTSVGRHREEAALQRPDEALVAESLADLRRRWRASRPRRSPATCSAGAAALPQYAVGPPRPGGADPGRRGAACPGWRSAGRRTTASASRP